MSPTRRPGELGSLVVGLRVWGFEVRVYGLRFIGFCSIWVVPKIRVPSWYP